MTWMKFLGILFSSLAQIISFYIVMINIGKLLLKDKKIIVRTMPYLNSIMTISLLGIMIMNFNEMTNIHRTIYILLITSQPFVPMLISEILYTKFNMEEALNDKSSCSNSINDSIYNERSDNTNSNDNKR